MLLLIAVYINSCLAKSSSSPSPPYDSKFPNNTRCSSVTTNSYNINIIYRLPWCIPRILIRNHIIPHSIKYPNCSRRRCYTGTRPERMLLEINLFSFFYYYYYFFFFTCVFFFFLLFLLIGMFVLSMEVHGKCISSLVCVVIWYCKCHRTVNEAQNEKRKKKTFF